MHSAFTGVRHSCSAAGNTCEELWRSTCRVSPELPAVALFACRSHSVASLSVRSSAVHVPDTTTVWSRLLDWREEVARKLLPVQWPQSSLGQVMTIRQLRITGRQEVGQNAVEARLLLWSKVFATPSSPRVPAEGCVKQDNAHGLLVRPAA